MARSAPYSSWIALTATLIAGAGMMLLIDTPDTWISGLAQQFSAQRLQLSRIEGGVIAGSADFVWQEGSPPPMPLGRWEWHYAPRWEGLLNESISALSGPAKGQVTLQMSWDGMTLYDADFFIQVSAIQLRNPLWVMVQPSADLHLHSEKIQIQNDLIVGEATLTCNHGYSPQVRLPDLGSWKIQWQPQGTSGSLKLVTLKGPLHVDAEGQLNTQPLQLKLSGRLWSEAQYTHDLEPIIKLVGPQQWDGSVAWKLKF